MPQYSRTMAMPVGGRRKVARLEMEETMVGIYANRVAEERWKSMEAAQDAHKQLPQVGVSKLGEN